MNVSENIMGMPLSGSKAKMQQQSMRKKKKKEGGEMKTLIPLKITIIAT